MLLKKQLVSKQVFVQREFGTFTFPKFFVYKGHHEEGFAGQPWTSLTRQEAIELREALNEAFEKGDLTG